MPEGSRSPMMQHVINSSDCNTLHTTNTRNRGVVGSCELCNYSNQLLISYSNAIEKPPPPLSIITHDFYQILARIIFILFLPNNKK